MSTATFFEKESAEYPWTDTIPRFDPIRNMALSFNGRNQYVLLSKSGDPNYGNLDFSGAITIEAWVRQAVTDKPFSSDVRTIVVHNLTPAGAGSVFLRISQNCYQAGTSSGMASVPIPLGDPGNWVFLAGVYNPAARSWLLYRNGVASTTPPETHTDVTGPQSQQSATGSWTVGGVGPDGRDSFFGLLTGVRVWKCARSASQVVADMNFTQPGAVYGIRDGEPVNLLAGNWHMNEGFLDTAFDYAYREGRGNNGSLGGGVKEHTPEWVVSAPTQMAIFDGGSEFNMPHRQIPDLTVDFDQRPHEQQAHSNVPAPSESDQNQSLVRMEHDGDEFNVSVEP